MKYMLVKKSMIGVLFFASLMTAGTVVFAQDRELTRMERDLQYFMSIWVGEYDNVEQLRFDRDAGRPDTEAGERMRVHSYITRVDLPVFGPYVMYVEEYKDDNFEKPYRQRIYELVADEGGQLIRVKIHFLTNAEQLIGAHADLSKLVGLTPDNTSLAEGCDVLVRRNGNEFIGSIQHKACGYGEGAKRLYVDYHVKVTPSEYWFRDQALNFETDEPMSQLSKFAWHKLNRARGFICMVDVPKESGSRGMRTQAYVRLHDLGGKYSFTHPDGRELAISLRKFWSYSKQDQILILSLHETDLSGPTLGYSWSDSDADVVGLYLPDMRLQCDVDTPDNRRKQNDLRSDS